jgi:hypothetical protein
LFDTSRPNGQNNPTSRGSIASFCGTGGTLEDNPHNNVHNFVGGIMAGAGSSRDLVSSGRLRRTDGPSPEGFSLTISGLTL